MFLGLDPLYLMLALPGLLLGLWAQFRVQRAFGHYSQVPISRGLTGAAIAARILEVNGIRDVRIEPAQGFLSDHYDPTSKTLRLSPDVYQGRSVAAAGVAAHEVGHAIQHARGYAFLQMRSALVPVLSLTSTLAMPVFMIGMLLAAIGMFGLGTLAMKVGALLFAGVVVFQLVTLPVEFDASKRALAAIHDGGLVTLPEQRAAREVLNAAALTYVAAAVSSALTLLYFLIRSGLLGSNRDE
jgi:Zn-dependent membrane protease YugP